MMTLAYIIEMGGIEKFEKGSYAIYISIYISIYLYIYIYIYIYI